MRNEMKQLALKLDCYVLGASAFGVFIRWLQLQIAFDDNGLCGSSSLNVAVVLIVLAAAAVFYRFIKRMKAQQFVPPAAPHEALANTGRLFSILRWVIGGMMCLGALVLAMSCETDEEVVFLLILAGLALLSGVAFPLLMKKVSDPQAKISLLCLLSMLPVLMYALWLVVCYKANDINSVVWAYAVEIIAVSVAMIGFFYNAGYVFGQPKPWHSLFFSMIGAMLCVMCIADERYFGMQLIFISTALMFMYYTWVIIQNMGKKPQKVQSPVDDGFDQLR